MRAYSQVPFDDGSAYSSKWITGLFNVFEMVSWKDFFNWNRKKKQPVPQVDRNDVERVIRRDFSAKNFEQVLLILDDYGCMPHESGKDRVQLAALKLGEGNIEKLRRVIDEAKTDYRDVLAAAEYPGFFKIGATQDTPAKVYNPLIDADWQQYSEWLRQ
jgi:hypothetical protein